MNQPRRPPIWPLLSLSIGLSACSALPHLGPDYQRPELPAPEQWQVPALPVPHDGQLSSLKNWWAQLGDPLLVELIERAESESATLADAQAKIANAYADSLVANAATLPQLNLSRTSKRSVTTLGGPAINQNVQQVALAATWEVDLFGGRYREQEQADASYSASQFRWHQARVSLAAETANAYLNLRLQEQRIQHATGDNDARQALAQLKSALGEAGFYSPPQVDQALANAAEAADALLDMQSQRDQQIKALVALTAIDEKTLRDKLAAAFARLPEPTPLHISSLPADILRQRPDLAAAERDLAAASANIGATKAAAYPRLTLAGNVTPTKQVTDTRDVQLTTWLFSPTLQLPLFDGGRVDAHVDAATDAYVAATKDYRQKARDAVREVEQALVRLQASGERGEQIRRAADSYRRILNASEVQEKAGLASRIDVEENRRAQLSAELSVANWQHERIAAWVALYRAVGGGWQPGDKHPAPHAKNSAKTSAKTDTGDTAERTGQAQGTAQ